MIMNFMKNIDDLFLTLNFHNHLKLLKILEIKNLIRINIKNYDHKFL